LVQEGQREPVQQLKLIQQVEHKVLGPYSLQLVPLAVVVVGGLL
jgi:hypothetical protein